MAKKKRNQVQFAELPANLYGCCNLQDGLITIDLKKDINIVKVYLHELCHRTYPTLEENVILILENEIWSWLSQEQVYDIARSLFGGNSNGEDNAV